jgi:hypothetical protein
MLRIYPPAWVRRVLLLAGDRKTKSKKSCHNHSPLPISPAMLPFYQMSDGLTRVVTARRLQVVPMSAEPPSSSSSPLS